MNDLQRTKLIENVKGVRFDECMKKHTTMRVGGNASAFVCVKEPTQLLTAIRTAKAVGLPHKIVGSGSNIVVRDGGYDGLVISIGKLFGGCSKNGTEATFGAGMPLFSVGMFCALNELSGLEWAFGIPGTVGGACFMNAGSYGHEWGEFVTEMEILDGEKCLSKICCKEDFAYRNSIVKNKNWIVLSCTVKLAKGEEAKIKEKQMEFLQRRKSSQPLEFPNSGSVFKRCGEFIPSKAIDELGLKGARIGDAEVSKKHAGFIINKRNATCQDIENLIQLISEKVFLAFGVQLEPEIEFLGDAQ